MGFPERPLRCTFAGMMVETTLIKAESKIIGVATISLNEPVVLCMVAWMQHLTALESDSSSKQSYVRRIRLTAIRMGSGRAG